MANDDQDIIVVGAGLAGLTTARELRKAGRRVLILEGRDRLGGRVFTSEFAGTEVELGGAFVHWFQPHLFSEMTRYGISHEIPPEPTRWSYMSQGRVYDSTVQELMPQMTKLFERCFPDARGTLPLPYQPLALPEAVASVDHLSMQDRIDERDFTPEERDLLNAVLSTACSAPCSDGALTAMMRWFSLPGWDFGLMLDAVGVFPVRTADLIEALLADARADVLLSTPVTAIAQRDERVTVSAREGETFSASAVVVAVPLNTLGEIDFSPELAPEKRAEVDRGQASRGLKVWAHVRGDLEPVFLMAPDSYPMTFIATERVLADGSQLLVAFGPDAERLPADDKSEVQNAFAQFLPEGVEILGVTGHDWWTDEYARGTWSVFRPGQLSGALGALQAPHGRVVFAGSDIADGWNGFMDGAIESGLRAARSVGHVLKKMEPTTVAP